MTTAIPVSVENLGFKSGLEIHHQLGTAHKLFCRCPTGYVHGPADARIVRHMRPTLSELGEYDRTALMEFKTRKNVTYELFRERVCTYEMDDTPPFPINQEALDIAIEIALSLNCSIVDEIHVSRKQYLDGSIPTGFQRTAVVGVNGHIPYKDREITLTHVTVEEDACREMGDTGHDVTFRTDRLSTPLVEVITGADMRTPEEVAEVDALLGRIIRASGKVRRGIGSVRQDVNVSIEGGVRVEIKGVPRTGLIPALTRTEALRQRALLDVREELRTRGITASNLGPEKRDVTALLMGTASDPIRCTLQAGGEVGAIALRGLGGGLLNTVLQPGWTLADEFAGRIRVIACLDVMPNLYHSDDPVKGGPSPDEWRAITEALQVRRLDVAVIAWGTRADVKTALEEIRLRAVDAAAGVPLETRQVRRRGNTDFERLLPGADRMYPDTDSLPIQITAARLERIRAQMPETAYAREARYRAMGLHPALAAATASHPRAALFERIAADPAHAAPLIAVVITQALKAMQRAGIDTAALTDDRIAAAFAAVAAGTFTREVLLAVLTRLAADPAATPAGVATELGFTPVTLVQVNDLVSLAVQHLPDRLRRKGDEPAARRCVMGMVMQTMKGRFPGKDVAAMVNETLALT